MPDTLAGKLLHVRMQDGRFEASSGRGDSDTNKIILFMQKAPDRETRGSLFNCERSLLDVIHRVVLAGSTERHWTRL